MKKHILFGAIAIAILCSFVITVFACGAYAPSYHDNPIETTISEVYIPSEPLENKEEIILEVVEFERVTPTTLEEANNLLEEAISRRDTIIAVYEGLLSLGYSEEHPAVIMAKTSVQVIEADFVFYVEHQAALQEAYKWNERAEEHPIATQVWLYMKNELGWNDAVCAGIMGNMMAECGGHTLDLHPDARNSSSGCYGLCQWHPAYYKNMQGASLEQQLEFLGASVQETFDGWAGKSFNMNYEDFLALTDCQVAAKKFCLIYERPGGYNTQRSNNALKAYDYFVN